MNIEERLTRLESLVGSQNESLTPNYLTYDPVIGQVGANFSGVINAQGLILPAGTGNTPSTTDKIEWQDPNVRSVGDIFGFYIGLVPGHTENDLWVVAKQRFTFAQLIPGQSDASEVNLIASDDQGNANAQVQLTQNTANSGARVTTAAVKAFAAAGVAGPLNAVTLINESNASDFLRLITTQQLAMSIGLVTLTWTASNLSANIAVNHGLGRTPQVVLATAFFASAAGQIPALNTFTYTGTQFTLNGDTRTSFTGTCQVNWLAIG